jgi:hypothetical protein
MLEHNITRARYSENVEHTSDDQASQEPERNDPPLEDLFEFDEDPVDFMSAESFPASDPLPPPSTIAPSDDR